MTDIPRRDYFAGLAMQALLARTDLGLVYRIGDRPPGLNEFAIGPHGETRLPATKHLANIAFEIAEAMVTTK